MNDEIGDDVSQTERLAAFLYGFDRDAIPARALHEAKRVILGFFGCAIAGARESGWKAASAVFGQHYGNGHATVLGRAERLPLPEALFLNAAAANILDFDDTHLPTVIHPAAPVVPVLLGMAEETPLRGRTVLQHTVLAIETMCRIGNAVHPGHYRGGWHITATCGVFGAAAAAGLAAGLDRTALANALGIAAGQAAGLLENLAEAAKCVSVGNAARNGYLAAHFAGRGMGASRHALEGRFGFFNVMGKTAGPTSVGHGFGATWEIDANTYKPYPVGVVLNPVVDACLALRQRKGFSPAAIRAVTVTGHPLLVDRTDRPKVESVADARLSTQHTVAVTLLRGSPGLSAFDPAAYSDPPVTALRDRVRVEGADGIDVGAVKIVVLLESGETSQIFVEATKGSREFPLSDDELATKTAELCSIGAPGFAAGPVIDAIWSLDGSEDAGRILGYWRDCAAGAAAAL